MSGGFESVATARSRGGGLPRARLAMVRHSPAQIAPVARAQRRRFLRHAGLRAADLDGLGLALLDNWSRAQAKVELLDRYFAAAGFLDASGEPRPAAKVYFADLNSARLAADRLAEHLKARGVGAPSMVAILQGTARRVDP